MRIWVLLMLLIPAFINAQIPSYRLSNWSKSGKLNSISSSQNIVHIEDFGGGTTSDKNNDSALSAAITYLSNLNGGSIQFDKGVYLFKKPIVLKDSIVLEGKGNQTILSFNLSHQNLNCININGSLQSSKHSVKPWKRNDMQIEFKDSIPTNSRFLRMAYNDSALCFSSWAFGEIGQIIAIDTSKNNKKILHTYSPIRTEVKDIQNPYVQVIDAIQNVGIKCLKIIRVDSTVGQTSNIAFRYAMNCSVIGVEIEMCNFAHILFERSAHNLVKQCYLHNAFSYGGGGKGYGVAVQSAGSDNKIENSIFESLRHSILVQSGANGNVFAYNYSTKPYGSEMAIKDISGDMVCHGNYAHSNLFEGNICQNIIVDNSHGKNGPYNTFFRNKAELYGVFTSIGQDSQNFIANEIPNNEFLKGQFITNGSGHFIFKNTVQGTTSDLSNPYLPDTSLIQKQGPAFWKNSSKFIGIGIPFPYNNGNIPAKSRYSDSINKVYCIEEIYATSFEPIRKQSKSIILFPNPASNNALICIHNFNESIFSIRVFSSHMTEIAHFKNTECFTLDNVSDGLYYVLVNERIFLLLRIGQD